MVRVYEKDTVKHCKRCVVFFYQFVNRIRELYPEIYNSGTSEGNDSLEYFKKWNWYATIVELSNDDLHKVKDTLKLNVHEAHLFLAHKIDKMKMIHKVHTQPKGNTTQL